VSVGTAFWPRQRERNAKEAWGEWAGYHAAAAYADSHDIEYNAIREAAALIDVSPLYKYVVEGPDAARLLDRVMTRDVSALRVDRAMYTPWCDEEGKVLDDGTVTRLADDRFRITAADPCFRWFLLNATGLDVEVRDVSESTAGLALQGRLSRDVLEAATGAAWDDVRYFGRRTTTIADVDVDVTRTGYTGDRGYELWIPVEGALDVWDRLIDVGGAYGIRPAGIRALDVARVEAGLILLDADYTSARHAISPEQTYSPFELGLGRLVEFRKAADFNGRRALLAEQAGGGPPRRLVGLELAWAGIEGMYAKHGLAPMISPLVQRDPHAQTKHLVASDSSSGA
jgi:aminomethyltransferase